MIVPKSVMMSYALLLSFQSASEFESNVVNKDGEKRLDLMWRYRMCLYRDGRWNEAEASFVQVLETRKRMLGEEHRRTVRSMRVLAYLQASRPMGRG